jgi:S1-C subfamily serine protease
MKDIPHSKKNTLVSFSEAIGSVADKVSQSVVSVRSRRRGNGSGVIWTTDGHIVTCSHIVRKLDELEVSLGDGKSFQAKVIGNDFYSDIAVLKIETNSSRNDAFPLKPIEIGDSENLKAGQFVLALANPYGEYPSITQGIITSERSSISGGGRWWASITDNIVITDARLNPGYSGGPLVDVEGKMIGLNAAYISSRGIAIRASKVKNVVNQLIKEGSIKEAYIGIVTDEISLPRDIGAQLEPSRQEEGLIVLSVEKDTAAKKAGLLMGDIIVKFDNDPITNIHDLRRQLLKPDVIGKSVKLGIIRGEKRTELTITPQEASRSN